MTQKTLTIGQLARRSGCSPQGVRYYEQAGLLPPPLRTEGNQRRYRHADAQRLAFIRHARELGFSIEAIRELLSLTDDPEQACEQADAIATAHLANVRSRIARLQVLESELQRMLTCGDHGAVRDCRVIEVLADHAHCATDHGAAAETDSDPAQRVTSIQP
ncbi:MerR family transcriptional regulator [Arhodomonas sp. AD133]|uniref:MerR family transcriptional regulator n=1 Tax=Arhodomonas sp. AD133 TaxID=3415009 RepID=UPI003EBEAE4E